MHYDLGPPKNLVNFNKTKSFCIVTENESNSLDMLKSYQEAHNLTYPLSSIEKNKDYVDMYMYCLDSSSNTSSSINFYLNNIQMLEKFNHYFKNRASYLIKNCDKNRILIANETVSEFMRNNQFFSNDLSRFSETLNDEKIENKFNNLHLLSHRENECVKFILKGYTSKEIAKELVISNRTVDTYINRIKTKYNVRKIIELVSKLEPYVIL